MERTFENPKNIEGELFYYDGGSWEYVVVKNVSLYDNKTILLSSNSKLDNEGWRVGSGWFEFKNPIKIGSLKDGIDESFLKKLNSIPKIDLKWSLYKYYIGDIRRALNESI